VTPTQKAARGRGNIPSDVQPGDFYVVPGGLHTGPLIAFFEQLDKEDIPDEFLQQATQFQHAGLVGSVRYEPGHRDPIITVLEEEGNGMVEVEYHYWDSTIMWSTGALHPVNRDLIVINAKTLEGRGYGWMTYGALTLHHNHINLPGLKKIIELSRTQICSQSVDWAWDVAGNHIFTDKRWPGDVKPSDLAYVLLAAGAFPIYPEKRA
jgi:hypothetical protein